LTSSRIGRNRDIKRLAIGVMTSVRTALSRLASGSYRRARRAVVATLIHVPRRRQLGIGDGPAPLFRTVFFELRTRCNGRCTFCAASVQSETRPDVTMPFDTYAKVIEELAGIDYAGEIAYHVNNEPLLVPDLDRFVRHARERLPRAWIRIYTNGLALSRVKGESLLRAGIDELTVNWYAADPRAPLPSHLATLRDEVLPRFHPASRVRTGNGPERPGDRSIFRFNINRRRIDEFLDSRAGSAPNKQVRPEDATGFCEHPFTQLNVTVDGRVGRCCADFYFQDVMGNVNRESVLAIWRGGPLERARRDLLRGDRSQSALCRRCDFRGVPHEGAPLLSRLAESVLYRLDRLLLPPVPAARP
jgi:radical SAM protein with 4Fe4S-binding SPASM domain